MEDGYYDGVIGGVRPVELRYNKDKIPGFELEFKVGVFNPDGTPGATVEIYEEFSGRYGQGIFANRTQAQLALENLRRLGYQFEQDLSRLDTLVNQKCRVRIVSKDKDGNPFKSGSRIYFSFNEVKPLEGDVNALLKNIMQGVAGAPAPAPAPAPAAPAASPFNFGSPAPVPGFPQ